MRSRHAFTLIEAIALLLLTVVIVALALAIFPTHRQSARPMVNNTQVRGVHQSLVMYAQGNGGHFPGLDKKGNDKAVSVEDRLQTLLEGNYFTGEYLVSPSETRTVWTTGRLTSDQYSYALLQLPPAGNRRAEWRETLNADAVAISDRAVVTKGQLHSVHGEPGDGWKGTVGYNDNHVLFESTSILPTKYGPAGGADPQSFTQTTQDDLFTADGDGDALLIHSGNDSP